jgi:hypothetical protein
MFSIFNWADGRSQYQQPSLISWEVEVIDGRPDGRGDGVKTSQDVLWRRLGIRACLAVATSRHLGAEDGFVVNGTMEQRKTMAKVCFFTVDLVPTLI